MCPKDISTSICQALLHPDPPPCTPWAALRAARKCSERQVGGIRLKRREPANVVASTRALHTSTFQLKVSTFCGICWVVILTKTAQVEPRVDECER